MRNIFPFSLPDFSGKTILVTGAGRGVGAAFAAIAAEQGASVYAGYLSDLDESWAPRLARTTRLSLDVRDDASVERVVKRIKDETGKLDVLLNNAGVIAPIGHAEDLTAESLRNAYDVNVFGVHRMTRACLPLLKASAGVVATSGTIAAEKPMEGWTAYCCSKAAARMATLVLAHELEGSGVQFFFVGVPATDTNMQGKIRSSKLNPISRISQSDLLSPEKPASFMAWLCGEEGRMLKDVVIYMREPRFKAFMT